MNGVKKVNKKFHPQLPAVANEALCARTRRGNISPVATQTPGPQEEAKPIINMHVATIRTIPTALLVMGSYMVPTEPKTSSQITCQIPPTRRGFRRPNRSIAYIPGRVKIKLTAPRMIWVAKELEIPTDLKLEAP